MTSDVINQQNAKYCYLDLDFDGYRSKLAMTAAFVDATNARYSWSDKDLRLLGGSELSRVESSMQCDHEWSVKVKQIYPSSDDQVITRPPSCGNRMIFELFWDVAPLACQNFATLCANGSTHPSATKPRPTPIGESGKPLTYRNSIVHRCVPNFILQGGDFMLGNGVGGESIFNNGKKFKDEKAGLALKHDKRGVLSMGNSGKNSNTSQWFVTFQPAPQCDGKHVIFGRVVSGWEVLDQAEQYGNKDGKPSVSITVTDCGIWQPFVVPACGYWFDKADSEAYSGISPVFMVRPRVALVVPSKSATDKFFKAFGGRCSITPVLLNDEEDAGGTLSRIQDLLQAFAVEVVVIAPACKGIIPSISLPTGWTTQACIDLPSVVLEAKPVEALFAVQTNSWLSMKRQSGWHLDGAV